MSLWRRKAIEMLPELRRSIGEGRGPNDVWIGLLDALRRAYARQPIDDSFVRRIYGYAAWCLNDSRNLELSTAVQFCFYEHLPTEPSIRGDVGRWLSVEEFANLRGTFGYHLTEAEVDEFERDFFAKKEVAFIPPRKARRPAAGRNG